MTLPAALRHEYEAIGRAVAALPPAALARSTPCAAWRVADLVHHLSRDARRACIALASAPPGPPDVDAVTYWRSLRPAAPSPPRPDPLRDAVAAWLALSEAAVEASAAAPPDRLVARQGHVLSAADLLATLVTEATIHGLDLADALDLDPWPCPGSLAVTRATLDGLLGWPPPESLVHDQVRWIRLATGRASPTSGERAVLGRSAPRLPLLS